MEHSQEYEIAKEAVDKFVKLLGEGPIKVTGIGIDMSLDPRIFEQMYFCEMAIVCIKDFHEMLEIDEIFDVYHSRVLDALCNRIDVMIRCN